MEIFISCVQRFLHRLSSITLQLKVKSFPIKSSVRYINTWRYLFLHLSSLCVIIIFIFNGINVCVDVYQHLVEYGSIIILCLGNFVYAHLNFFCCLRKNDLSLQLKFILEVKIGVYISLIATMFHARSYAQNI